MPGNLLIGRKLGDYMIVEMLGQGGMAHVYKGYDANLDRYAAVKVISQTNATSDEEKEYRERFLREARAIARLSHPRIVSIYQFGQSEDHLYYMAMKIIEGRDLRQILKEFGKNGKRIPVKHLMQILRDMADALDYAHSQDVIHRDVKPSNIMVTQDGHAVLTDFGLALNATEGTIGNTFGSVHYIAPEQAVSSRNASPQSDLYSLGVVVYECVSGKVPFDDSSAMSVALKHISEPPPPPSTYNPDISPQVEEVLMKMLDKDPRHRYSSGAAFVQALEVAFTVSPDKDTEDMSVNGAKPSAIPTPLTELIDIQEAETITDSSQSNKLQSEIQQARSQTLNPLASKERRRIAWIVAGVVVALLVGGFWLLAAMMNNPAVALLATETLTTSTPAASMTVTALPIIATDEAAIVITVEPSSTRTPTNSPEPTSTPRPTKTSTRTPTDVPPTATATPEPTTTPTVGIEAAVGEPEVLLRYDGRSLVIYNRAPSARIDISELSFVRETADGAAIEFRAYQWGSGNDNLYALRSGDCFQVWSPDHVSFDSDEFPADICRYRQGFLQIDETFWLGSSAEAVFEVRRGDTTLATCPAAQSGDLTEHRCVFSSP
jgi:serine/threonine protein kinase